MRVSVVIPTLNRDEYLCATLGSLIRQRYANREIIVADQNRTPLAERGEGLRTIAADPAVHWLSCPGKGVVYARNMAISVATGDLIVFVDDDVEIQDDRFLEQHVVAHERGRGTQLGAVCGREINPGGANLTNSLPQRRGDPVDALHFPRNYSTRVEWTVLSTANCSVRRDALLAVGCFDERFGGASYGDDTDLALRLVEHGYHVVYDPAPVLVHLMASAGGLRLSAPTSSVFSGTDRVLSSAVFYFKHIHHQRPEYRANYIVHHILRKTVLLRANVTHPWRLPGTALSLVRAIVKARALARSGHRCSFGERAGKP